jgi:hypothetical protein
MPFGVVHWADALLKDEPMKSAQINRVKIRIVVSLIVYKRWPGALTESILRMNRKLNSDGNQSGGASGMWKWNPRIKLVFILRKKNNYSYFLNKNT